jgi:hypothetical protein
MWPFKKKKKVEFLDLETTFSKAVIIAGSSKPVVAGIRETAKHSGLYRTWITLEVQNLPNSKLHMAGLPMPRTQAIKAAEALGQGFVDHLLIQKTHLESVADD